MFFKNLFKSINKHYTELKKEIIAFGFDQPHELISMIRPVVYIGESKGKFELGQSQFGGKPHLPIATIWPQYNDTSMVFLCQINCKQLRGFDVGFTMPKNGLLSFFRHFNAPENEFGSAYDFRPEKTEYKVIYTSDLTDLERKEFPQNLIAEYQFETRKMSFQQSYQTPTTYECGEVQSSSLSESDQNKLGNFVDENYSLFESQIGGYPMPVQAGADFDWVSAAHPNLVYNSPEFHKKATTFYNILSFTLDGEFEVIGESLTFFGIEKKDLIKEEFENTILIHQAT